MSNITEHRMSHLRNLSDMTVSSTSNRVPSPTPPHTPPAINVGFRHGAVSPPFPSPPSAFDDGRGGDGDYLSGHHSQRYYGESSSSGGGGHTGLSRVPGTTTSLRMSIFRENTEDLGDSPQHNTR